MTEQIKWQTADFAAFSSAPQGMWYLKLKVTNRVVAKYPTRLQITAFCAGACAVEGEKPQSAEGIYIKAFEAGRMWAAKNPQGGHL